MALLAKKTTEEVTKPELMTADHNYRPARCRKLHHTAGHHRGICAEANLLSSRTLRHAAPTQEGVRGCRGPQR
jgi:hypothetical protein